MSKLWKASGIAERALRKIGAFSINHTAADPEELAETLYWMDLAMAELAGTEECQWLIPSTLSFALDADTVSYDLANELGTSNPTAGVLFPVSASIRDSSGQDWPVEIISRRDYEDIVDKDEGGRPDRIYIDRTSDTQVKVHPVPSDTGDTLRLVVQTAAPSVLGGTSNGGGNVAHGFSAEWQRWLILQVSADIGDGPVRRLPPGEIAGIRKEAADAKERLMTHSNREHTSQPRRTRAYGA